MSSGAPLAPISSSTSARDQLGLGALAPRFEQPDGAVGRPPSGGRLEQAALEVVQRAAGGRRVVLGPVGQELVALGQRPQQPRPSPRAR